MSTLALKVHLYIYIYKLRFLFQNMCNKSNPFISYPCLMIIYYYCSSFVTWFFMFQYQTLIRHSATIFYCERLCSHTKMQNTALHCKFHPLQSTYVSATTKLLMTEKDSAQRLLLWADACEDSATYWYTSCYYPPPLEPDRRIQAAAAAIMPTVLSNVWSKPPYICDTGVATQGALMQRL